ncbi:MAG: lamin tail domain-containing protein [Planctomycetota bacterium]
MITEIMYDPRSKETAPTRVEWVEVYNSGVSGVNLRGWRLADEDGQTHPVASDCILPSKQAAVFIPGHRPVREFRDAWECDAPVLALGYCGPDHGLQNLSNNPSPTNEILRLLDASGAVVDEVNFCRTKPWPSVGRGGPSIFLLPDHLNTDSNDAGESWQRSKVGEQGAYACGGEHEFSEQDFGSPGAVPALGD